MGEVLFLSYASPDRGRVEPFYDALEDMGFEPWMDSKKLRAGQNWDFEIQRALDQAKIVLIFLSDNSVDRRGYVQREIKVALRKLDEKLVDDIYIIPVALDDVTRPAELSKIQFVEAGSPNCLEDIRLSVQDQLRRLADASAHRTEVEGIKYRKRLFQDSYDGIPGYEIYAEYVAIESEEFRHVQNASEVIAGAIAASVMAARSCAVEPDSQTFNIGQSKWSRTNTLDWILQEVVTSGRTLSVVYTVHHYGAGAAHPVSGFKTFNFFLSPVMEIGSIKKIIENEDCLQFIQQESRRQLAEMLGKMIGNEPDMKWIIDGTSGWESFANYSIRDEEVIFHFGSYQVAPYACGHQSVSISKRKLSPYLTDYAANSLDLGWVKHRVDQQA